MQIPFEIVLDMDGVIVDLVESMLIKLNRLHGENLSKEDITSYNFHDACQFAGHDDIIDIFTTKNFFYDLSEIPGAIDTIRHLIKDKFDVSVVTACMHGHNEKIEWFKSLYPEFDWKNKLNFVREKERFIGDVFIDDSVDNLTAYKNRNPDALVLCFDAPYNKAWTGDRVYTWNEVYSRVWDAYKYKEGLLQYAKK